MLNNETCEGCKTSYFSTFEDTRPTINSEKENHCCSFLYKELVNIKLPDIKCPCEECIVKPMCEWVSKQCCSLFSEFCVNIPFDCLKHSSSSSSMSSWGIEPCQLDKIKTTSFDKFYDKRKKNAIFKDSKFKIKNRRYL
jgi:hypothetical protein